MSTGTTSAQAPVRTLPEVSSVERYDDRSAGDAGPLRERT
jgi:hypothetical protein